MKYTHGVAVISFVLVISWWSHQWKHFPRYRPLVRGSQWSSVNSLHKVHWCRALMFSLICAWINGWVNNREAGELRRHRDRYDVTVMFFFINVHIGYCAMFIHVVQGVLVSIVIYIGQCLLHFHWGKHTIALCHYNDAYWNPKLTWCQLWCH